MSVDAEVYELNDGHIVEAMDRLHVACVYIDQILGKHPLLNSVPDFKSEIDKATETLANIFQELGQFDSITEIAGACELADGYIPRD